MTAVIHPLPAVLELRDLACARGGRPLFEGLSLRLTAGEWLRVQGANGRGKTSLLRVLAGLLPAAGGQVLWRGRALPGLATDCVYLGHAPAITEALTPLENLRWACELAGEPASAPQARAALADAGLPGALADRPARSLSQGQRRRCALARLRLARHRPVWLLDEPFNALDDEGAHWLTDTVSNHLQNGGLAIVSSHQPTPLQARAHLAVAL
jgi:heme exporter protein A